MSSDNKNNFWPSSSMYMMREFVKEVAEPDNVRRSKFRIGSLTYSLTCLTCVLTRTHLSVATGATGPATDADLPDYFIRN